MGLRLLLGWRVEVVFWKGVGVEAIERGWRVFGSRIGGLVLVGSDGKRLKA